MIGCHAKKLHDGKSATHHQQASDSLFWHLRSKVRLQTGKGRIGITPSLDDHASTAQSAARDKQQNLDGNTVSRGIARLHCI